MKSRAFTLVEMLVVIGIVLVLGTLITGVFMKTQQQGELAREVSAGRNLINAYLAGAADNNGELLPGYTTTPGPLSDDRGNPVGYPASGRYGWRVAKYLRGPVKGTLVVNKQARLTEKRNHEYFVYVVSLLPTFGMNATFIGGNETGVFAPASASARFGQFCVTQLTQVARASTLIVFCSARFRGEDREHHGFHLVEPPYTTARKWAAQYSADDPPESFGNVHLRYDGKAVAAMLDGHVELLDEAQLQDMRHWSNQAAEADDPHYTLRRL